jgi:hypothetical protein
MPLEGIQSEETPEVASTAEVSIFFPRGSLHAQGQGLLGQVSARIRGLGRREKMNQRT